MATEVSTPRGLSVDQATEQLLAQQTAPEAPASEEQELPHNSDEADADAVADEVVDDQAQTETKGEEGQNENVDLEAAEAQSDEGEELLYQVVVDGEQREVSQAELVKSYQLEAAAQKRLSQAAEERKSLEADRTTINSLKQQYEQALALQQEQLAHEAEGGLTPQQWEELRQADPNEYILRKQDAQDAQQQIAAIQQEREALKAEFVAQQREKISELIPEWQDTEVATRETRGIMAAGEALGFTSEELGSVVDARMVALLRKAHLYDELKSTAVITAKQVKSKPKMLKPGASKAPASSQSQALKSAQARFTANPNAENAAALYRLRQTQNG